MTDLEQVPTSILSAERCHLGEGPTYDRATDTAWWFDILEGRLFEARLADGEVRVHQLGRMASALARVDARRQLVVAEDGLYIRSTADGALTLYCPLEADNPATRSNDARVHPCGTFWIGTMGRQAEAGAGAIYALHRGELTRLFADITIPNAICFSPDGALG
jgi:sugar lactone lactonase YvrE